MIFLLHVENRVGRLGFLPRVIRCGHGNLWGRHLRLRDAADRHIRLAALGRCRGSFSVSPPRVNTAMPSTRTKTAAALPAAKSFFCFPVKFAIFKTSFKGKIYEKPSAIYAFIITFAHTKRPGDKAHKLSIAWEGISRYK